ncbi:MAG TPA: DUF268 domain-containing protein [Bryobacteraceae bacterium]
MPRAFCRWLRIDPNLFPLKSFSETPLNPKMAGSLKRAVRRLITLSQFAGFDPVVLARNLYRFPGFVKDLNRYQRLTGDPTFGAHLRDILPILTEARQSAGSVGGDYFHQDLWAARKLFRRRPPEHIDIGSRIDGFVAHVLVFMPVHVVDIRPLNGTVAGLEFLRGDATELKMFEDGSVASLSSLHAAEHFGLGRYSDPIDPSASTKFMMALQRVLAPGGRLYFSVPVGRQCVRFNAHRIFDVRTVLETFTELELLSFSFVASDGRLHEDTVVERAISADGCGLFEFTKL